MKASGVRVLLADGALVAMIAGCAQAAGGSPEASAPAHPARTSATSEAPMPGLRAIGPNDAGTHVTIRFGQLLAITPPHHTGGWRVTGYSAAVVRPHDGTGPADSHLFLAVSVGSGQITLAAGSSTYTVTVQVLRDLTKSSVP